MKISEFNYILPKEQIATHPVEPRDAARLLAMDKHSDALTDAHFYDLPDLLKAGDVLVFNDSKVIPARLSAFSNGKTFEVLLIKNVHESTWECWLKPGRKAKIGDKFTFSDKLSATLVRREDDIFILDFNLFGHDFYSEIAKVGEMPVPPYILKARHETHDEIVDKDDYQTIYAKSEGSVAAPTAGLHFTSELLQKLSKKGVQLEYVTLHVGLGTFQPVNTDKVEDFQIHSEYYEISKETAERLNVAKKEGRRIIAVGTTSVRVLESAASSVIPAKAGTQTIESKSGDTAIYIYPGYEYKFVDGMITNFHLPKSSLLLLVAAFTSKEQLLAAYQHAVENKYRFYSYGDGIVII